MNRERQYIRLLLADLKAELRNLGMWRDQPPPPQALDSTQPFCVDTLQLEEWLQYIFIGRIDALLDADAALPGQCAVEPYAQQQYASRTNTRELIRLLGKLDIMISRTP